jgi:hypothetical protein
VVVYDFDTISIACREWRTIGDVGSAAIRGVGMYGRSGKIGDLRDEGSTTICKWYYIENRPECQVWVRVCFMDYIISGPIWHKGPKT